MTPEDPSAGHDPAVATSASRKWFYVLLGSTFLLLILAFLRIALPRLRRFPAGGRPIAYSYQQPPSREKLGFIGNFIEIPAYAQDIRILDWSNVDVNIYVRFEGPHEELLKYFDTKAQGDIRNVPCPSDEAPSRSSPSIRSRGYDWIEEYWDITKIEDGRYCSARGQFLAVDTKRGRIYQRVYAW
jgi:hypothetical protein